MGPILILLIALALLWAGAALLAVCLCQLASRGDTQVAKPWATPDHATDAEQRELRHAA